jgi:Arc/MetJ family transcription regulator
MAREKTTITVDRAKLTEARALLGVKSSSAAVDMALSQLIRRARLRNDVEAYSKAPSTDEEAGLGEAHPDWPDLADDVDWDAEWPVER